MRAAEQPRDPSVEEQADQGDGENDGAAAQGVVNDDALLPGDDKPDAELSGLSTLPPEAIHRLWCYLVEGGPANAENLLRYAGSLIGHKAAWAEPAPLLRAGLYWSDQALPSLDEIAAEWRGAGGIVPIVFSGGIAPAEGSDVVANERPLGKLGSVAGGRALALLRLDRVAEALAARQAITAGGLRLTLEKPPWAHFPFPGEGLTTNSSS